MTVDHVLCAIRVVEVTVCTPGPGLRRFTAPAVIVQYADLKKGPTPYFVKGNNMNKKYINEWEGIIC